MLKFSNTRIFNLEGAIRGMRNPKNSWHLSDSYRCFEREECEGCEFLDICKNRKQYVSDHDIVTIGENDMKLMKNLIKAGTDHRKFMRQILVSFDICAPIYFFKEWDTYKIATVSNSTSTMHKITSKPIELSDFSIDDFKLEENAPIHLMDYFYSVVSDCEVLRKLYVETKDKRYWKALIQLLPESYNQTRTMTLNYEVIRNMYHSRKNHKLDEWSKDFVEWVETLPYCNELIIE